MVPHHVRRREEKARERGERTALQPESERTGGVFYTCGISELTSETDLVRQIEKRTVRIEPCKITHRQTFLGHPPKSTGQVHCLVMEEINSCLVNSGTGVRDA